MPQVPLYWWSWSSPKQHTHTHTGTGNTTWHVPSSVCAQNGVIHRHATLSLYNTAHIITFLDTQHTWPGKWTRTESKINCVRFLRRLPCVDYRDIYMVSVQQFQTAAPLSHLMPADVTLLVTSLLLSGCHFSASHFLVVTFQKNIVTLMETNVILHDFLYTLEVCLCQPSSFFV